MITMISLPSVTLFGIDKNDKAGILRAASYSTDGVSYGAVKIITEHQYFDGRWGYNTFCVDRMVDFVDTDHILIIHSDGYVQKPEAWEDLFLEYDYVGAVWDWYKTNKVGNGGFSLRSKRLLEILRGYRPPDGAPEDDWICRGIRRKLEVEHGIKFAPEDVARRFSIEAYGVGYKDRWYNGSFGFHGYNVYGLPYPLLCGHR